MSNAVAASIVATSVGAAACRPATPQAMAGSEVSSGPHAARRSVTGTPPGPSMPLAARSGPEHSPPQDSGAASALPAETSVESGPWATLEIPGFEPAIVSLPEGSRVGAPLLVATHGAGGNADWHCAHWRALTTARGYVLCLAGKRMIADHKVQSGYYYPDHHALGRELEAALTAFREAYPRADVSEPVFAGYSQGASMGALVLASREPTFARAALVEGGFAEWNVTQAKRFHARGGQRVLFACGRRHCASLAERAVGWLKEAEVDAMAVHAVGAGHTPAGAVAAKTAEVLPWLFAGDRRWE